MIIIFEGSDKTGKSTSAEYIGKATPLYNLTKELYTYLVNNGEHLSEVPTCIDRIDWMTHLAYRLALPRHEWNDPRVRTVFSAPEAHLVFKLHEGSPEKNDELYHNCELKQVNEMYEFLIEMLIQANVHSNYTMFRSISVIRVSHDPEFKMSLSGTSSAVTDLEDNGRKNVSNEDILDILRELDSQILRRSYDD